MYEIVHLHTVAKASLHWIAECSHLICFLTAELFKLFEPLIGETSIQYANGAEGRARRQAYDKSFAHEKLVALYPSFQKVTFLELWG